MTTSIDFLEDETLEENIIENFEDLSEVILSFEVDEMTRLDAMNLLYQKDENEAVEMIYRLKSILELSGIGVVESFLVKLCTHSNIDVKLKLYIAKELYEHEDLLYVSDSEDEDAEVERKKVFNDVKRKGNQERREKAGKILSLICSNCSSLPTPSRVQAIKSLSKINEHFHEALSYFINFLDDQKIGCGFRYKTLISLENMDREYYVDFLLNKFSNKQFVEKFFDYFNDIIKREFPKFKPSIENEYFYQMVIKSLSYKKLRDFVGVEIEEKFDLMIRESQLNFLQNGENEIHYRNLSGQYLLQKYPHIDEQKKEGIENTLLSFAHDQLLDENLRADAADILLQLGSPENQKISRRIINELGAGGQRYYTIYENSQNVHSKEVESSVAEILEFLTTLPLLKVDKKGIDFTFVKKTIEDIMREEKESHVKSKQHTKDYCIHCGNDLETYIRIGKKIYCNNTCLNEEKKHKKINKSLERIQLDRALYSKFNNTLENVLVKLWTYITDHEHETEMKKRLLEELEDMSGTCSSGFLSRLVNVLSGFGDFSVRISWEDQITGNLTGRINAQIRKITEKESIFCKKFSDIVILKLQTSGEIIEICKALKDITTETIVESYIKETGYDLTTCLSDFQENVLNELTVNTSEFTDRQNFSLFFRTVIPQIREDMYKEFKEHLDDTSFDLYMRKALMKYEGVR